MTERITEQPSLYHDLEKMDTAEIVSHINDEDHKVAAAVKNALPQIIQLINATAEKMLNGGRLFYIGAGTSGRLGVLDASECPPTYGVPAELVVGIIAGGDSALRIGIENAEDDPQQGWLDLEKEGIKPGDVVIGIAASGTTPYVIGALQEARKRKIITGCIVCNPGSPVAVASDYPVEVVPGPEFVTGSTRMKSGSAQKMVLNMISTTIMIRLDRVKDNRMVNMQITNNKLLDRGVKMIMEQGSLNDYQRAKELLLKYGTVRQALQHV